ncbi:MAG TPA: hypothetical protein VFM23_03385, partial [Gemmatimonadales bacterium]|nr:hypothetical protein [Gemmatimonadales bacterium]
SGGGGVLAHCAGTGTTISADSFAHYSGVNRLDLIGNVQIRDTGFALDARLARYYLREERLEAHNNVVATNRRTGSVLRGPNLNYWRAVPGVRDTVEMYATQRPTVHYFQVAPQDSATEPYVIVADRLRLKGDDRMWAGGRVTVDRSDFSSRSDSLMMDQTRGFGVLTGRPRVEGRGRPGSGEADKSYTLVGTRIELTLAQRDVRAVKAMGNGKATGADWVLTADTIDLRIENKQLQQTFAWGDSLRPHAVSALYTIQSDSLAIDSPGEILTEARAFGDAFSTAKRDSTTPPAETDWITGDTVTIRFAQVQDSLTNTSHSRLRELVSRGSARALTHHPPDTRDTTQTKPSINYSRGNQITVALERDRIDRVVVAGKADGVHLEPRLAVVADSLRQAAPPPPPPPPIP